MKKIISLIFVVLLFFVDSVFARNHIILEDTLGRNNYYTSTNYSNNYNGYVTYDNRYGVGYESAYFPQNTNAVRNNYNNYYNYYYNNNYYYTNPYQNNNQNYYQNYNNYNQNYWYQNRYTNPYNLPTVSTNSRYPGCGKDDIVIGGQVWASCNSLDRRTGSDNTSGWFYNGAMYSAYTSNNGKNSILYTQDKNYNNIKSWTYGPCANGYRLPTRGEWETAQNYARQNNVTIARLLNLPYNGGYMAYKDSRNNISVDARLDIGGAYWTSTTHYDTPYVMHLGSKLAGYRTDGTDMSYMDSQYRWQYTENSLELVPGLYQEIANVRCIKNI